MRALRALCGPALALWASWSAAADYEADLRWVIDGATLEVSGDFDSICGGGDLCDAAGYNRYMINRRLPVQVRGLALLDGGLFQNYGRDYVRELLAAAMPLKYPRLDIPGRPERSPVKIVIRNPIPRVSPDQCEFKSPVFTGYPYYYEEFGYDWDRCVLIAEDVLIYGKSLVALVRNGMRPMWVPLAIEPPWLPTMPPGLRDLERRLNNDYPEGRDAPR